ncbi:DUF222 domain-containing protein [Nocardia sp. NPDC051030]|uniref:HNH endonuclease signature motif containing protein n=1 Tax=Nocardia sp. NPDC051030 TaxID=3155162 RepID=UPI003425657A
MRSNSGPFITMETRQLAATVTELLDAPLAPLSDDEVIEVMREVESSTRQLAAVFHRLIVAVVERSIPARAGAKDAVRFLEEALRLAHGDAYARVKAAKLLGVWHDMSGNDLEPPLPRTAQGQRNGEISVEHARAIAKVMDDLPHGVPMKAREQAEHLLAEHACGGSPDDLPRIREQLVAHLDPDGTLTDDIDRQRRRGVTISRQGVDGMSAITGALTPTLRALFDPILAKLARPGMCNPADPESPWAADDSVIREVVDAAAARDTRTPAQRNHDALLAFLRPELGPAKLGSHRGLPVAVIFTMSVTELEQAAGVVTTASGGTVPIPEALKLAEHARPFLALFDHAGMPLHLGRSHRLASPAQRLALIAAERGCTRPGCNAPATLAAVHHITEYAKGGNTDISNLTLACDHCHALVHDGPGGWKTVVLGNDSEFPGRTGWIAPPHIDPRGTPRVNNRHHPGELLAQARSRIRARDEHEAQRHQEWLAKRATASGSATAHP